MDNNSFENFQLEDFVSNESFINYHFKSNENDSLFWEKWISNHTEKKELIIEAGKLIDTLSLSIPENEYQQELDKITTAINLGQSVFKPVAGKMPHLQGSKKITKQFVVITILIILSGVYALLHISIKKPEPLSEIANKTSRSMIITLSDSSVVSLEPHSHLRYPLRFEGLERNVYLEGNAQFSVKRNIEHPFKVHTENIVATVLGTIFNIKSSGDSAIVVELLQGKLNVEAMNSKMQAEQSVLLEPNERAVYVTNDKHLYKNLIVTEHRLSFVKSSFDEIATQIKNAYGITLINSSKKKDWSFTGDFKNSTAKDIVENICLVKKLSFVIKDDTIVIK